jgi:acyl-coenzyme A synthetase/AMP-(fatty) acid ligase
MVSPKEVEDVLYELDGVTEAAVIGVPDEILGNAVKAFVALSKDSGLTQNEVILHCQKNLEGFKVPKFIEFLTELPKTSTGKINKRELKGLSLKGAVPEV